MATRKPTRKQSPGKAKTPTTFASDLEYLELEMQWIEARVGRLALERKLRQLG